MTRAGDTGPRPVQPEISVVIAPELLAHIAGVKRFSDGDPAPLDNSSDTGSESGGAVPSKGAQSQKDQPQPGQWQLVSLRCDGRRPHVCTAMVAAHGHDSVPVTLHTPGQPAKEFDVTREITLYRQEAGGMLVHATYTPAEEAPARPVYRLSELRDAKAWRDFLDHVDAASCFDVQTQSKPHVAPTLPRPFYQMSDAPAPGQQL